MGLHIAGEELLSCLSLIDFKLSLNMTVIYRSQNIYASHIGNILSLREIQEYVAKSLNVKLGPIEFGVISAHIYKKDLEDAKN